MSSSESENSRKMGGGRLVFGGDEDVGGFGSCKAGVGVSIFGRSCETTSSVFGNFDCTGSNKASDKFDGSLGLETFDQND